MRKEEVLEAVSEGECTIRPSYSGTRYTLSLERFDDSDMQCYRNAAGEYRWLSGPQQQCSIALFSPEDIASALQAKEHNNHA